MVYDALLYAPSGKTHHALCQPGRVRWCSYQNETQLRLLGSMGAICQQRKRTTELVGFNFFTFFGPRLKPCKTRPDMLGFASIRQMRARSEIWLRFCQREAIASISILAKRRRQENSLRTESGSIKFGVVAFKLWDAPILLADDES